MHVAEYFDIQHADSQALAGLGHMNQLAFQPQAVCGVGRQPQRDPGLQRLGKLGRAHMIGVIVGHAILLALAGLFAGRFFTRYADKRADGFLRHAMYFHGIPVIRSRRAPSGLDRSLRA